MKPTSSTDKFYEEQLLRSFGWLTSYVEQLVRDQIKKTLEGEVEATRVYYEEERQKLQKVANDLFHYVTGGGELKEGITVKHVNDLSALRKEVEDIKKRLDKK